MIPTRGSVERETPLRRLRLDHAREVLAPGPVHRFIIVWMKMNAYGHRRSRLRCELVTAVLSQLGRAGFQWLRDVGDLDREVRALCKECLALGFPVLSWGLGYFYGNPRDPKDRRIYRHQIWRRAIALLRQLKLVGYAMEDEARRLAGEIRIAQPMMPPPAMWKRAPQPESEQLRLT